MLRSEIENAIDAQLETLSSNFGMRRDGLDALPVQRKFATIIMGVRRCGKSTMLRQWVAASSQSFLIVQFEDFRLLDFTSKDFSILGKIIVDRGVQVVVLDEIQDIPGWELFVNGLLGLPLTVFVTGSNAKMLSVELGTKLSGRHLDYRLEPFSYSEFLRFRQLADGRETLELYLATGGFPAFVESGNRQVLEELFNDILYRDIIVRYHIANTQSIKQLAVYLLNHIGTRLSPSRLKDAIHVQTAKTVLEYFDHLEECCLIDLLEQWAESPKARMLAQKKVYACDTGLASAFERSRAANLGHKLENVIFLHLKRRGGDLTYYLGEGECECDFLLETREGTHEAVQVAYVLSDDNREREFEGLLSAMRRFGIKKGTVVTAGQCDYAVVGENEIAVVPASDYLLAQGPLESLIERGPEVRDSGIRDRDA